MRRGAFQPLQCRTLLIAKQEETRSNVRKVIPVLFQVEPSGRPSITSSS
jgi:hypothetical protein